MNESPKWSASKRGEEIAIKQREQGSRTTDPELRAIDNATKMAVQEGTAWPTIEAALEDPEMQRALERNIDQMTDGELSAFREQLSALAISIKQLGDKSPSLAMWIDLTSKLSGAAFFGGLLLAGFVAFHQQLSGQQAIDVDMVTPPTIGAISGFVIAQCIFGIVEVLDRRQRARKHGLAALITKSKARPI